MVLNMLLEIISQVTHIFVLMILGSVSTMLEALAFIFRPVFQIAGKSRVPVTASNKDQLKLNDAVQNAPKVVLPGRSFIHVHNRLYLALYDAKQAEIMAQHELKQNFLVVPIASLKACPIHGIKEDSESFNPSSLIEIFKFDEMACTLERKNPQMKLVFCTGAGQSSQIRVAFLIGCHMIMSHGIGFEETHLAFKHFHVLFERFSPADGGVSVQSCWRALSRAKCLNWVDFRKVATKA